MLCTFRGLSRLYRRTRLAWSLPLTLHRLSLSPTGLTAKGGYTCIYAGVCLYIRMQLQARPSSSILCTCPGLNPHLRLRLSRLPILRLMLEARAQ